MDPTLDDVKRFIEIQIFEGDGIDPIYKGFKYSDGLGSGDDVIKGNGRGRGGEGDDKGDGFGSISEYSEDSISGDGSNNSCEYGNGNGCGSANGWEDRTPGVQE